MKYDINFKKNGPPIIARYWALYRIAIAGPFFYWRIIRWLNYVSVAVGNLPR